MNIWRKRITYLIIQLINDEAVYRTATATPGLLMILGPELSSLTVSEAKGIVLPWYSRSSSGTSTVLPFSNRWWLVSNVQCKNSGKSNGVVWKKLPQGGCKGNQAFLRGAAPKEIWWPKGLPMNKISRQYLQTFHCFFRLLDKNSEDYGAQSCPTINSELSLVNLFKVWQC